ncbi:MAG: S-adenosylmethionine decarboxylase [Patescibacteria group bacterium]|jgi:S-adenosylmethionine decarboxylase
MKPRKTVKFGEHIIFDAYGCSFEKLNSMEFCYDVMLKLCDIAGMNRIGEPYVVRADGNETLGGKDPGGYSGFLVIQESHISIHTFAKRGFVTVDVYSCKPFAGENTNEIVDFLIDSFEAQDYDIIKLNRGLKYPSKNIY